MSYAKIITFSSRGMGRSQEEILISLERKLEEFRAIKADLLCFPEEVLLSAGDGNNPNWERNNLAALELMQRYAAELRTNIVTNLEEPSEEYPGKSYNTSFVINREGEIIGKYRKKWITFRAIGGHGLPGGRVVTADTDIGRIGLMTCFDIGWRGDWQTLSDMGAELVVWPSAYHGGNLLNAYAAVHMYYVVSSVWNAECRIIDPFGNDIAESTIWDPCAIGEVYPGSEIFHFDHHTTLIPQLRREYGERIHLRIDGRGNMFELASRDPELKVSDIKAKFGMSNYREYHAVSTADNIEYLGRYPEK